MSMKCADNDPVLQEPLLIVLAGLPGAGKTTIARELARTLGACHVRIDSIEQAMRQSGVVRESIDDAGYRVGYGVAEDNLRLGRTVVADSVNPLELTRDAWRAAAERARTPALDVEVICSDVREHRQRVESRQADVPGHSLPTWADVLGREYHPWTRERLVVDTAGRTTAECVNDILDAVGGQGRQGRVPQSPADTPS
jgi:predicted kinase